MPSLLFALVSFTAITTSFSLPLPQSYPHGQREGIFFGHDGNLNDETASFPEQQAVASSPSHQPPIQHRQPLVSINLPPPQPYPYGNLEGTLFGHDGNLIDETASFPGQQAVASSSSHQPPIQRRQPLVSSNLLSPQSYPYGNWLFDHDGNLTNETTSGEWPSISRQAASSPPSYQPLIEHHQPPFSSQIPHFPFAQSYQQPEPYSTSNDFPLGGYGHDFAGYATSQTNSLANFSNQPENPNAGNFSEQHPHSEYLDWGTFYPPPMNQDIQPQNPHIPPLANIQAHTHSSLYNAHALPSSPMSHHTNYNPPTHSGAYSPQHYTVSNEQPSVASSSSGTWGPYAYDPPSSSSEQGLPSKLSDSPTQPITSFGSSGSGSSLLSTSTGRRKYNGRQPASKRGGVRKRVRGETVLTPAPNGDGLSSSSANDRHSKLTEKMPAMRLFREKSDISKPVPGESVTDPHHNPGDNTRRTHSLYYPLNIKSKQFRCDKCQEDSEDCDVNHPCKRCENLGVECKRQVQWVCNGANYAGKYDKPEYQKLLISQYKKQ